MQSDAIHSRYRRTELDGNRLIPEYTSSIRFGIMMDDGCGIYQFHPLRHYDGRRL
jgi:hypothetical protein